MPQDEFRLTKSRWFGYPIRLLAMYTRSSHSIEAASSGRD